MKKHINEKGITLIALIITIIVMLIMVAVTISVAIQEGIFSKARTASVKTQIEADKEELLSAISASFDDATGQVKISELQGNLGSGWTTEDSAFPYAFTKISTRNSFLVYENGHVEETVVEIFDNDFNISVSFPDLYNNAKKIYIRADTSGIGNVSLTDQQAFEYMCDMCGISNYSISKKTFLETAFGMSYDSILSMLESELGYSNLAEESEETIYKMCIMGEDYDPNASLTEFVSQMASENYSASTKVLRVNGEDVSEDVEWSGRNDAYYTFADYGEYTIELELDGNKARTKVIVADPGIFSYSIHYGETKTATITGFDSNRYNGETDITIPDKIILGGEEIPIVGISGSAFYNKGITSLSFENGNNLTTIGEAAFNNNPNLTGSIVIPASVTSIGDYGFYQTGITSLSFEQGSNLTTIGTNVFRECTSLTGQLTIPAGVTNIGNHAFYQTGITSLSFENGSNLTTIGEAAFCLCGSLIGTLTIPANVTSIGDNAFEAATITSLAFENGSHLTTIGVNAFANCPSLAGSLIIPASVTSIERQAFYYTGITSLAFANNSNLATIGEYAFLGCEHLAGGIIIPPSVTTIESYPFSNTQITSITVSSTLAASSSSWAPTGVEIIISD